MADRDWRITGEFLTAEGIAMDMTFCLRDHVSALAAGPLSAATVVDDVDTWLTTLARAMAPTTTSLSRWHANHGGPWGPGEGDDQLAGDKTVNGAGTLTAGTGADIPHGVCARVAVRSDLATRRGRGRFHAPWPKYVSYLSATSPDRLAVGSAYWNAVTAFANALLAGRDVTHDLFDHHYSLRVHSRKDATTRDATAVVVRTGVSYLRSRITVP